MKAIIALTALILSTAATAQTASREGLLIEAQLANLYMQEIEQHVIQPCASMQAIDGSGQGLHPYGDRYETVRKMAVRILRASYYSKSTAIEQLLNMQIILTERKEFYAEMQKMCLAQDLKLDIDSIIQNSTIQ